MQLTAKTENEIITIFDSKNEIVGKLQTQLSLQMALGKFKPITRESFCMNTDTVCQDLFIKYREDFSQHKSDELKILIIDNAAFHSTKVVKLPKILFYYQFLLIVQNLILLKEFGSG